MKIQQFATQLNDAGQPSPLFDVLRMIRSSQQVQLQGAPQWAPW